ncbi:glycosyltransferase family 2 protein [Algoriphagus namhaensis]|uniref:Glycosyltransferase family 2 protein n=1 Tax=Algoriphagus namhaensis TaxID=915353 RepID=A0ABV8AS89_9BACT
MKVSILIPSFNNSEFISETIQSVLSQSYPELECIVVDDGSTDATRDIVSTLAKQDLRLSLYSRPDHLPKGANSCRNYGASLSSGDLLLFLDADDLLSLECLENRLKNYQDQDLLIGSTGNFSLEIQDATPFSKGLSPTKTPEDYLSLFLEYSIPWHTSSGLWRRAFFDQIGGFNPALQRFQDVEIHVRALSQDGIKLKIDPTNDFTSYYRKSAFHQKMTLEKRRYIFDQGMVYLETVDEFLPVGFKNRLEGTMIYLMFRFEEVFTALDLNRFNEIISTVKQTSSASFGSWEFQGIRAMFEKSGPNRLRKYLSFVLYRMYARRIESELGS